MPGAHALGSLSWQPSSLAGVSSAAEPTLSRFAGPRGSFLIHSRSDPRLSTRSSNRA